MKHQIDAFKHSSKQKEKFGIDEKLRNEFTKRCDVSG